MAGAVFGRGACRRDPEAVYASATDLTSRGRHGVVARQEILNGRKRRFPSRPRLAPLAVLSPGPRLAGIPSKGVGNGT